jgi:carbon monoxide dehydrogenase subunit G
MLFQDIARSVRVPASPEQAWSVLLDFPRVASWLKVVRDLRAVEPMKRYTTVLEDRVGPFAMRADLAIDVRVDEASRTLHVSGSGEDRQIASRISAALDIAVAPDDAGSRLDVSGRYEITGRIATLGAGAIRKKGDKVLADFFDNATRELGAT